MLATLLLTLAPGTPAAFGVTLFDLEPPVADPIGGLVTPVCGDDESGGAGVYLPDAPECVGDPPHIMDLLCVTNCKNSYLEATQEEQAAACECFTSAYNTWHSAYSQAMAQWEYECGLALQGPCADDVAAQLQAAAAAYQSAAGACVSAYEAATAVAAAGYQACMLSCCF